MEADNEMDRAYYALTEDWQFQLNTLRKNQAEIRECFVAARGLAVRVLWASSMFRSFSAVVSRFKMNPSITVGHSLTLTEAEVRWFHARFPHGLGINGRIPIENFPAEQGYIKIVEGSRDCYKPALEFLSKFINPYAPEMLNFFSSIDPLFAAMSAGCYQEVDYIADNHYFPRAGQIDERVLGAALSLKIAANMQNPETRESFIQRMRAENGLLLEDQSDQLEHILLETSRAVTRCVENKRLVKIETSNMAQQMQEILLRNLQMSVAM